MKVSLHTAQILIRQSLIGLTRGDNPAWQYSRAVALTVLPWAAAPGRISRRASAVICFSRYVRFRQRSCQFRPDRRGPIQRITAGLRFFGPTNAVPPNPPYGKVCPVTRPGGANRVSMFCNIPRMIWVRSVHRQSRGSRRATDKRPDPTAGLLAQASQSLWLV